jgi:hypothetical protein
MRAMHRRRFLIVVGGACAAAPVLAACGGDGSSSPDAAGASFIVMNQDDADHLHQLEVRCIDLIDPAPVTYTATGPHEHTIALSAQEVEAIAAGETVEISFTDGHAHRFVIERPADAC